MNKIKTFQWKNNKLYVLDQRLLPGKIKYICCNNYSDVAKTIKDMAVRGAPAIGVTAAYGLAIAGLQKRFTSIKEMRGFLNKAVASLGSTRPTAVNLFWAIERMKKLFPEYDKPESLKKALVKEAEIICSEDIAINKKIGDYGAKLIKKNSIILTHCNAGALATADYGTAVGVIRSAHKQKKVKYVFVDETRPYLQGARLTAWELAQSRIPYYLITDNMAGHLMKTEKIGAIVVGADRIAANGDTANKIGTYSLSILAKEHKIPFYIAAPVSTIDFKTKNGSGIKIEERSTEEVIKINGKSIAPKSTKARHPAFDVTPAKNITRIVTEKGVYKPNKLKQILRF